MQIGRRIYYELTTGNRIVDTGERSGLVVETTITQDFETYAELAERVPGTVGVFELEYGQYAQDFAECNGYMIDVNGASPALVFSYPDPNEPESPPVYRNPLSEEVTQLKSDNLTLMEAVAELYEMIIAGGVA